MAREASERPGAQRRFHGRRRGRKLRPGRQRLLAELLPRIAVELPEPGRRLDLEALFCTAERRAPPRAYWLEIGPGAGEHLAWQAAAYPEIGLLAAEYFENGIAACLQRIESQGLSNLRLYRGDARDLLAALPEGSISRGFVLFPDPWPKTRHHKRRLIRRATLDRLAQVMLPGAELRLATDDPGYLTWMLERLTAHPDFAWLARRPADWRRRPDDWPATRYEVKTRAAGRRAAFLRFLRRAGDRP